MKAISFKGVEAYVTAYEKEYERKAPSTSICLNDGTKLISEPKFSDARPFPEVFREKIEPLLKKSGLWHKNSELRILKDIPRTGTDLYPVMKQKKNLDAYTGTMYRGCIYFGGLDEYIPSSGNNNYTAVVKDCEPVMPSLINLERSYADETDFRRLRPDPENRMKNSLEGILDYCNRKAEVLGKKEAESRYPEGIKTARTLCEKTTRTVSSLLELIHELDEALARQNSSGVTKNIVKIRDFYKKQLTECLTRNRNIFFKK